MQKCNSTAWVVWLFVCLVVCFTYLSLLYAFDDDGLWLTGWYVPDGITLWDSAVEDSLKQFSEIFRSYRSMWGMAVLDACLVGTHKYLPAVLNFMLLVLIFGSRARYREWSPILIFLLLPYYLVAFPLPSKDIVIAALFVLAVHWYSGGRTLRLTLSLSVAVLMIFVRDGYGVMLAASFIYIALVERSRVSATSALIFVLVVASLFWVFFETIFEGSFIYERSMGVAEMGETLGSDNLKTPLGYFIRLFGNATNLAFRPIFSDTSGRFHILSFCYWISGLTLLYALACCVRAVLSGTPDDVRLGMLGLMLLLLISVTPYVQPRYLLPVCLLIPMFTFACLRHLMKIFSFIIPVSLAVSIGYQIVGNYPPPAESTLFSIF